MSTAAPAPAPEVAEAPAKKGNKKLIVIGAIVAAAIAAGAGGAWFFLKKPHEGEKAAAEAPKPKKTPTFVPFDAMVVNLRDTGVDRMMQIAFAYEAADPKTADVLKANAPAIRNRLIMLFSSKTSDEIAGREGKEKLAAEVLEETRQAVGATKEAPVVEAVHFSSLIIQ